MTGSEQTARFPGRALLLDAWSRLKARFLDAEHLMVQRLTGTVFLIRVASAVLAFGSLVLLARWMGSYQFGIYVYVWTWVLLLGQLIDLGLGTTAQRFIPEYRDRGSWALLRGFNFGSRWFATLGALGVALVCAGLVRLLEPWLDHYLLIPLYLACLAFPAYALNNVQEGISRSYDWIGLSMMPAYVVRQLLLTALMAAAWVAGLPMNAETALIAAGLSIWLPALGQLVWLNRRLKTKIPPGPRAYNFKGWIVTALPILMVEGFYALLMYTDILMLELFRPPDEVAVYYAAAKTLALVAFIHYSIAATTAHRFSSYHVAGDREGLARFLKQAIKWTFWPSLAATLLLLAFGRPILRLFGAEFADGYYLMFILAVGLLARAAIGPIERLLNMLGQQRACAMVHAAAFGINFCLCLILIPLFGAAGAAISTAVALVFESIWLFVVTKRRLGFHVFVWGAER
ncbi:MAG: polysaccharide biosynthesis C-terminal domain-containing protein [Pseudolabrys sp.]